MQWTPRSRAAAVERSEAGLKASWSPGAKTGRYRCRRTAKEDKVQAQPSCSVDWTLLLGPQSTGVRVGVGGESVWPSDSAKLLMWVFMWKTQLSHGK